MSFQQKILRTNKFVHAYNQYNQHTGSAAKVTTLLRNSLWCLDSLTLSLYERQYLDTRWSTIEMFLNSVSPEELILKMTITNCCATFQILEYTVILFGFSQMNYNGEYLFDKTIALDLIDHFSEFDCAIKTTKCMKLLMKMMSISDSHRIHRTSTDIKQLISHILKKFPDIKTHNFMHQRIKGKLLPRFSDSMIENFF